jgi:hypothetical protein
MSVFEKWIRGPMDIPERLVVWCCHVENDEDEEKSLDQRKDTERLSLVRALRTYVRTLEHPTSGFVQMSS